MAHESAQALAGDLVLQLAGDGQLILGIEAAQRVIDDIELTLAVIERRRGEVASIGGREGCDANTIGQEAVDLCFAETVDLDRIRTALEELPKYLSAFRIATTFASFGALS